MLLELSTTNTKRFPRASVPKNMVDSARPPLRVPFPVPPGFPPRVAGPPVGVPALPRGLFPVMVSVGPAGPFLAGALGGGGGSNSEGIGWRPDGRRRSRREKVGAGVWAPRRTQIGELGKLDIFRLG